MFIRSAYTTSGDILAGRSPSESPAVLPLPTSDIRAGLSGELGMVCKYSGIYHETYESWLCENPPVAAPALVSVYSRKQDLEKADYLIAEAGQAYAPAFFTDLFELVFPQSDPLQLQDWITKTAPTLTRTGDTADTTMDDVLFVLSVPSLNSLQLDIGEFKQ
jgi:hypothetical protein